MLKRLQVTCRSTIWDIAMAGMPVWNNCEYSIGSLARISGSGHKFRPACICATPPYSTRPSLPEADGNEAAYHRLPAVPKTANWNAIHPSDPTMFLTGSCDATVWRLQVERLNLTNTSSNDLLTYKQQWQVGKDNRDIIGKRSKNDYDDNRYLEGVWPISRGLLSPAQSSKCVPSIRRCWRYGKTWTGQQLTVLGHARCHVHRIQTLKRHSTGAVLVLETAHQTLEILLQEQPDQTTGVHTSQSQSKGCTSE